MLEPLGVAKPEGAEDGDVAALLAAAKKSGKKACEADVLRLIRAEVNAFGDVTEAGLGAFGYCDFVRQVKSAGMKAE